MSKTVIAAGATFTDCLAAGGIRNFNVRGSDDLVVVFETADAGGASAGARIKDPNAPFPQNGVFPDLSVAGPAGRSAAIQDAASFVRYVVLKGTATSVWMDSAPLPTQGPTGPAGPTWTSANSWAKVTGTSYVATAGELVLVNTAANTTVTLPTAVGIAGQRIRIQDATNGAASHNITVATTSSQTVNGTTPAAISANSGGFTYVSDGANWFYG